jgi:hypothetical protein
MQRLTALVYPQDHTSDIECLTAAETRARGRVVYLHRNKARSDDWAYFQTSQEQIFFSSNSLNGFLAEFLSRVSISAIPVACVANNQAGYSNIRCLRPR